MTIRPKAVLQVLNRDFGGVMRATGAEDLCTKLLRSMRQRNGLVRELREHITAMSETNQLVTECDERGKFCLIAVPEALEAQTTADAKEGTDMPAPAGQRKTTYARDGQGHELPAHLGPNHVGPLTVTYKDPEAGEAIATAAELVREELVKSGKSRHGRDELLATIQGLLLPLYDGKAEVAQTLAMPVLCFLVDNGYAKRVPIPGQRRNEIVIEIILPEAVEAEAPPTAARQDFDPIEMLARLAPELEAARERLAVLEPLVENAVDPDTVARITGRAEEIQGENEELRRKLEAAGVEKEQILDAQKTRLARVRSDHTTALGKLRKEHETAMAALRKELEIALTDKAALEAAQQKRALPADLQRRVEKLLGN